MFVLIFISITIEGGSKILLLLFLSKSVLPMFSAKSFIMSGVTFKVSPVRMVIIKKNLETVWRIGDPLTQLVEM